jgi:hypothetical protein
MVKDGAAVAMTISHNDSLPLREHWNESSFVLHSVDIL